MSTTTDQEALRGDGGRAVLQRARTVREARWPAPRPARRHDGDGLRPPRRDARPRRPAGGGAMNCSCHPVKASFEVEAARARVVEAGKVVVERLRGKVPNVDTIF